MTLSDKIREREALKKKESNKFYKRVGENLRRLRFKHNYTQEYLADTIGRKNYSSYGKIESGEARLSIEDAAKLSKLYKLSIDELLDPGMEKISGAPPAAPPSEPKNIGPEKNAEAEAPPAAPPTESQNTGPEKHSEAGDVPDPCPLLKSFLDVTVRLDGTEVSLVKQIKLLERVNQVLSEPDPA